MGATLTKSEDALRLSLKGDPNFQESLAKAKTIPGRRFNGESKCWEFPLEVGLAERIIHSIQPHTDAAVEAWIKEARAEQAVEFTTPLPEDADLKIDHADVLYPYQRACVDFLADHPHALLGDDMGLGKTVQSISAVLEYAARNPAIKRQSVLIICPSSLKGNWQKEIKKWIDVDAKILPDNKGKRTKFLKNWKAGWLIVNWEKLRIVPELGDMTWLAVIADEAHRAKNRKAQQTKFLWQIQAPMQLALTGTPIMNSPDELWAIMRWLEPTHYTSYWRFYEQYVDYYEGYFGRVITGVRNPEALRFELGNKMVRRTKSMAVDLPEKVRQHIEVELSNSQRRIYETAMEELWLEVEQAIEGGDEKLASALRSEQDLKSIHYLLPNGAARMVRLRQICSSPALLGGNDDSAKLDAATDLIVDAQPKQFVVFSLFKGTCSLLKGRLDKHKIKCEVLTGDTSPDERTRLVQAFQDGEIDVLVCTIAAGGVGLTLTAADTAIFLERDWVPANNEQAEDRLHRIGQDNKVTIIIIEAKDTVDTGKVTPTNRLKSMIVQTIIDTDQVETV